MGTVVYVLLGGVVPTASIHAVACAKQLPVVLVKGVDDLAVKVTHP